MEMSTTAYRLFAIAQNSNSFLEASKFGLYSAKVLFNSMVHSCSRFGLEISAPPQILDHNLNLKLLQPQRNISILMFWAFSCSCFGTCNSLLMYPRICIFFCKDSHATTNSSQKASLRKLYNHKYVSYP